MSWFKRIRIWIAIVFMYACKRTFYRWQLLALRFRRIGWWLSGRGKAPPFTFSRHVYACVSCHTEKLLDAEIGQDPPPIYDMYCSRCRRPQHMGLLSSTVEIVR